MSVNSSLEHGEVEDISGAFFEARRNFAGQSWNLFHERQSFFKQLEELRKQQQNIFLRRDKYVQKTVSYALRDAELRYQKENMLEAEAEWNEVVSERQETISECRSKLKKLLEQYTNSRKKISLLQSKVSLRSENDRMSTLNTVAFCGYGHTILENEIKKLAENNSTALPNKKRIKTATMESSKLLASLRDETKNFHLNMVSSFRRKERILFGRGKEVTPASAVMGPLNSDSFNLREETFYSDEIGLETVENRVASRIVTTEIERFKVQGLEGEVGAENLDGDLNNKAKCRRRQSILQTGEVANINILISSETIKSSNNNLVYNHAASERRMRSKGKSFNVIYDPYNFRTTIDSKRPPSQAILDLSSSSSIKEEDLVQLVKNCFAARGKMHQMKHIKEALDIELSKYCSLLLAVLEISSNL